MQLTLRESRDRVLDCLRRLSNAMYTRGDRRRDDCLNRLVYTLRKQSNQFSLSILKMIRDTRNLLRECQQLTHIQDGQSIDPVTRIIRFVILLRSNNAAYSLISPEQFKVY